MLILGIESSCDETAVALVRDGSTVLSNVISSQVDIHSRFGGVVPELACRAHQESLIPLLKQALQEARVTLHDVEAVAVTYGPGLIGALMVGLSAAKAIAMVYDIPLLAVNHIEAHMYANLMADASITVPCIGLIVSGGHTLLSHVRDWGDYEVLGQTCDDAAGEAFDKVAKMMGLAYPGGPIIDQMAKDGNAQAIPFPRARIKDNPYGFSFSGLKTSVLYYIRENPDYVPEDVAASFQEAVVDVLCKKSFQAAKAKAVAHVIVGGGVSLNSRLREHMQAEGKVQGIDVFFPDFMFSADNAGMIAGLAYQQFQKGVIHPLDVDAVPNLPLLNWG